MASLTVICPAGILLDRTNAEVRKHPAWTRGKGEGWGHFFYRLCTEGHTFFDAWLLAAGCIGQVRAAKTCQWH